MQQAWTIVQAGIGEVEGPTMVDLPLERGDFLEDMALEGAQEEAVGS